MGAWCEAVLATIVSQLYYTMKPRVRKKNHVETSWCYTVKKGKLFITGEVFLLDIGLLMGAGC
jgi:hypothetical protein